MSDVAGRAAIRIFEEYPPHDRRFLSDDLGPARLARRRPIAIGAPAGIAALANDAGHPAANLLHPVLAKQLADQAPQPDSHRVGDAIVNGADLDRQEGQLSVNAGEIGHVAREPVERLDEDHVEFPPLGRAEQLLEARPAEHGRPGAGAVLIGGDDGKAIAMRRGAAQGDLILYRLVPLQLGGEARIDRGASRRRRASTFCRHPRPPVSVPPDLPGPPHDRGARRRAQALSPAPLEPDRAARGAGAEEAGRSPRVTHPFASVYAAPDPPPAARAASAIF
ncbi:hypothetical protein A8B73_14195 [Methylosinus sp. 3S-1]|nr:hypothetical protein A8B73_14195 [Methylosinus sp. 3S-1]